MNRATSRCLLIASMCACAFFGIKNQAAGQEALHDSLRQLLAAIEEHTKDSALKAAVKEAKAAYKNNLIDDSAAKKLIAVQEALTETAALFQPESFGYSQLLVKLLRSFEPAGANLSYATSLHYLGIFYEERSRFDSALLLYRQAHTLKEKIWGREHRGLVSILGDLAILYRKMGKFDSSLHYRLENLALLKKYFGEEHPAYLSSLNDLAVLYESMGEYDRALPLYERFLNPRQKIKKEDSLSYASKLQNLAFLRTNMGQYETALPLYLQALAIIERQVGRGHPVYNKYANNLAFLYFRMGQYEKALPLIQEVLERLKRAVGENHQIYAYSLSGVATMNSHMGQTEEAEKLFLRAQEIQKKVSGDSSVDYAMSLYNLGSFYATTGNFDKALENFQQCLAIRKITLGENSPDYGKTLYSLATVYDGKGEYAMSIEFYKQALPLLAQTLGKTHTDYATCLFRLGDAYYKTGENEKAGVICREALDTKTKIFGTEHPETIHQALALVKIERVLKNNRRATALLLQASKAWLNYAQRTFVTLSEREKINYIKTKSEELSLLPSWLFSSGVNGPVISKQLFDNELLLKGMVLLSQQSLLASLRKTGNSSLLQQYNNWQQSNAFLGKQMLLPGDKRIGNFDSLLAITNRLEQQLSLQSTLFNSQRKAQSTSSNDVSLKLSSVEAALEFIRFPYFNKKRTDSILYAALLLLPGDSAPRFIPLCEEKQLQRLLALPKNTIPAVAIQKLYRPETDKHPDSLYRLIWQPLEKYLNGVETVYFAPAGLLHQVCFNALRDGKSRSLIARYDLRQVLSTRAVAWPAATAQKPSSVALWGGIAYNRREGPFLALRGEAPPVASEASAPPNVSAFELYTADTRDVRKEGFGPLPFSKKEVEAVKMAFQLKGIPARMLNDTAASEEAFKALNGKSPQVLHIATHGFFLPVPEKKDADPGAANTFTMQQNPLFRSGLVLAGGNSAWKGEPTAEGSEDGILTAYEIAQLDLSNTDLVVLSACNTALGDLQGNEGVIGLQRAFRMAGVKQLVVSLWQVPDKATMELMALFYKNRLSGQTTREALRNAQRKMKEKYPPFFWAAFVLIE